MRSPLTITFCCAALFFGCASESKPAQSPPTAHGGGPESLQADPHSAVGGQPADDMNPAASSEGDTPKMPMNNEPIDTNNGKKKPKKPDER